MKWLADVEKTAKRIIKNYDKITEANKTCCYDCDNPKYTKKFNYIAPECGGDDLEEPRAGTHYFCHKCLKLVKHDHKCDKQKNRSIPMKLNEFNTLGVTKQLAYINRLEEINRQKQALIESMEKQLKQLDHELMLKSKPWMSVDKVIPLSQKQGE